MSTSFSPLANKMEKEKKNDEIMRIVTYFQRMECGLSLLWQLCSVHQGKRPEVHRRSSSVVQGLAPGHPLFLLFDLSPSADEIRRRRIMLASSSRSRRACLCFVTRFIYVMIISFNVKKAYSSLFNWFRWKRKGGKQNVTKYLLSFLCNIGKFTCERCSFELSVFYFVTSMYIVLIKI